jgi:hypothetical protein
MAGLNAGSSHPLARRQRLEVLGGFVGFFTVVALLNAVVLILTGRPSAIASIVLLVFLVLGWYTYRAWKCADNAVKNRHD